MVCDPCFSVQILLNTNTYIIHTHHLQIVILSLFQYLCTFTFLLSKGVTSWVKTWKSNGWRLKGGGTIVNKDDFQKLDKLNAELEVVWVCFICTRSDVHYGICSSI